MAIVDPLFHLAERSNELFFIFDLLGNRFTYMNPMFCSFFDTESAEVDYKAILDSVHPADKDYILAKFQECCRGEAINDVECRIRRGDYQRWLRITAHMVVKDGERLLMGQAEDFTVYKSNTEVLNNHNNRKNAILNILTHDLAGPIGTIDSLSALLAKNAAKYQDPTIDRYISLIRKISKSSIKLIHDFGDREFLESSSVPLLKTRVDLVTKIGLAAKEYMAPQDYGINFSCNATSEHIYVEIDEDKFMQVINNLVSNALKFTPKGGSINVFIREKPKEIVISVADTGVGIPARHHSSVFEKFSDARREGLNGEPSTGLGLSIVKTIVEWHGGTIRVESEENRGSTFYITLPRE